MLDRDWVCSHGETIAQARRDWLFKTHDRDPSDYESLDVSHVFTIDEAVVCYRVITGACSFGVSQFLERLSENRDAYSISEIVDMTEGEYGSEVFREFFAKLTQDGAA